MGSTVISEEKTELTGLLGEGEDLKSRRLRKHLFMVPSERRDISVTTERTAMDSRVLHGMTSLAGGASLFMFTKIEEGKE